MVRWNLADSTSAVTADGSQLGLLGWLLPRARHTTRNRSDPHQLARVPEVPYHRAITKHEIPLSIGGIGQSRTMMLLLRKAHLGEVTVSVWPEILKEICAKKNINVLW